MKEDWSSYSAALEQIIRLEPHFWSVWDFQGHNLSYNISVEFDDYRDRFAWVMKGIEFLKRGMQFNSTDPRFLARIGWFFDNKIGRADEHVQYRKLFAKQQDDKNEKPNDNYLMAYEWYIRAKIWSIPAAHCGCTSAASRKKSRNKPGGAQPTVVPQRAADGPHPSWRNDGGGRHIRAKKPKALGKRASRMEPVCLTRFVDSLQLHSSTAQFGIGANDMNDAKAKT